MKASVASNNIDEIECLSRLKSPQNLLLCFYFARKYLKSTASMHIGLTYYYYYYMLRLIGDERTASVEGK